MNLLNQIKIVKDTANKIHICPENPQKIPIKESDRNKYYSLDPEFENQESFFINLNIQHKLTSGLRTLYKSGILNFTELMTFDRLNKGLNNCGKQLLIGECDQNKDHNFVITQRCRKESCIVCGQDDSSAHITRKRKVATGLIGYENIAYMVFTIPEDIREHFLHFKYERYEKDGKIKIKKISNLKKFERKVKEIFKDLNIVNQDEGYFVGGLLRWHFLGDDHKESTGTHNFHPHLNVLLGTNKKAWMDEEILTEIKNRISEYLRNIGSEVKQSITHISWRKSIKEKWHVMKYVTRATLTHGVLENEIMRILDLTITGVESAKKLLRTGEEKNTLSNPLMFWKLAQDLIGFRNNNFFGSVRKNDFDIKNYIEQDETRTEIEKNTIYNKISENKGGCPICGHKLVWELNRRKLLEVVEYDGFYMDEVIEGKSVAKFDEFVQNPLKTLKLLEGIKEFL